jgi:hypothetical protein
MNKKIIAVIAAVVAIVVIVGGGIGGYIYQLSSQKIGMKDILVSVDKKTNGVEVGIITVPTEFSGTATVGITYNEASVYDTTVDVKNGEGKKTILYTDFVTENGNYTFEIAFKDKTKTKGCSIYGVVTKIDVYANAILDGTQPKIEVEVWPDTVAPLGDAVVTITKVGGGTIVNAEPLTLSETIGIYSGTFSYTNSGYYTVHAELTNPVKNGSTHEKVTGYVKNQAGGDNVLVNLAPELKVHLQDQTVHYTEAGEGNNTVKVEFDAAGLAEDYDGGITYYVWELGYNWTDSNSETNDTMEGINVTYWYPRPPIVTISEEYIVHLYIHDAYTVISTQCTVKVYRV